MNLPRPTTEQMRRFALRETDPAFARSFEPIAAGPLVAMLLLAVVCVAGALSAPVLFLARALRGRR